MMNNSTKISNIPRVLNKHHLFNIPENSVYIGRGSKFGNPFVINQHGNRAEVIAKYKEHIQNDPKLLAEAKTELSGKNLVCFCAPLACHGDVLLEIANSESAVLNCRLESENE